MLESAIEEGLSSLRARARVATIGLYIFILLSVVQAAIDIASVTGAITLNALPSQAFVNGVYFVVYAGLVAFLGTALVVAFWIHRAHKNLIEAGYDGLEFTPGWSIGWFFVPFANLYMPYKAMREAWHVSLGEGDMSSSPPPILTFWWSSYLAGNIAGWFAASVPSFDLVSNVALICAAWSLSKIIGRITAGQDATTRYAQTFA
jgi:hypothetical protein